jgi:hypothetical protein
MMPMSDARVLARGVVVLAAAGLCLIPTASASAGGQQGPKSVSSTFEYGQDVASWYWNRQIDQEATTPTPLPPPIPPVSQRVRLPSPQCSETLPVGVNRGQHERMAAVRFDLVERGVTLGSEIKKLTLSIEEGTGTEACANKRREQPSFHPELAKIQACLLQDLLSQGENERFEDRPKYSEADCAEAKREVPAGKPPVWKFDLTKIAQPWGTDPFSNNGLMLLGVIPPGSTETWQVNLKIPVRDSAGSTDPATKQRASIELEFVPGEEPTFETTGGEDLDAGASTIGGTTGTIGTTSTGTVAPSTDLTGSGAGSPVIPGTDTTTEEPPTTAATAPVASTTPEPRLPAYVWLAIPLGLLALSAVRSVVLEPVGGPRPDGVIAAIRRRNAERRGGVMREATDPMARLVGATRRGAVAAGRHLAAAGRAIGKPLSRIARSVRRS